MKAPLYLIDSYALIYRAYFAFMARPLRNSAGENVSCLFGYARLIATLLEDAECAEAGGDPHIRVAAVFDSRGATFRKEKYPEYKATRQKAPQDLHSQVPKIEDFLQTLGITMLRAEGFEADDIIATLASVCKKEGRDCYIISSDKDLLQLVGNGTYALRPIKNKGTGESSLLTLHSPLANYERIGPDEVKAEWGVTPEKILDLLSLTGDSSDNVPGVKGVGDKTALKLIQRYGSLDGIYQNIASIEGAVGKKLAESREMAYLSRDLITLVHDVPLKIGSTDEFSLKKLQRAAAAQILLREEIPSLAKLIAPELTGVGTGESAPSGASASAQARGKNPQNPVVANDALLGEGVYTIINEAAELERFFKKAKEQGYFSLDFETDSLDAWHTNPIGIALALKPKEAFYVPLDKITLEQQTLIGELNSPPAEAVQGDDSIIPFYEKMSSPLPPLPSSAGMSPSTVRALLAPLLADPAMTIIAHNAKFDYEVSRGWGLPRWKARVWDTMVAAWLADSDRAGYSLDSLAASYFNYTALSYRSVVPKGGTLADVPVEAACRYAAEDADLCLRLKLLLEPRLEAMASLALFTDIEMPLLPVLAEMEGAGIQIEGAHLKKYGSELGGELDALEAETWQLVGHEFNLSSPKQMQEVLFVERKLKPTKKIKTGWSTDVAVLEELAREDRVPELILRHRALAKLKSTYVDTLADMADAGGRLHTSFIQTGTATGRLSSRDPNLQNIPIRDEAGRRIREAFVAGDGKLLISADYSQIELVVLAHLSGDKNLIDAFKHGKDVHARTAALIFGIDEERVDPAQRRMAKVINFGVMYGMSAFRLAGELKIGRREAAAFIEAYFATYSGVKRFIDKLIAETEQTGSVSTIFGRRRAIPTINSANKTEKAAAERIAVNTPIQGSAADIVKKAMLDLDKALAQQEGGAPPYARTALRATPSAGGVPPATPPPGNIRSNPTRGDPLAVKSHFNGNQTELGLKIFDAIASPPDPPPAGPRLLLQVHDELILECPEDQAEETAKLVRSVMENAIKLSVPLRVTIECGKRWGGFH